MADIINAIASLAWPLIVVVLIWRVGPALRDAIREREVQARGGPGGVELSVGGQPVSAQQAVDDQRREIEKVRALVSLLAAELATVRSSAGQAEALPAPAAAREAETEDATSAAELSGPSLSRLLWVDDQPVKNAYELGALRDRGVEVVEALSTEEALAQLEASDYDVIVTDMHRVEQGIVRATAGLELLEALNERHISAGVVVYTSLRSAGRFAQAVGELGALGITADATELFELLGLNFGPQLAVRMQAEVGQALDRLGFTEVQAETDGWDFIARREGRCLGVEVKAWVPPIAARAVDQVVARLVGRLERGQVDEAWLVSNVQLARPGDAARARGKLRLVTIDELRQPGPPPPV